MDDLIQNINDESDSDYSDSSDSDTNNINYDNIDYDKEYFQNNSLQSEYLKTRNKLFTKDIMKHRIIIDTHNIKIQEDQPFDTSNYTYYFHRINSEHNSVNYNNTTGYDNYKNVIGFRFIRAIIPNRAYTINNTNNTFLIKLSSDTSKVNITYPLDVNKIIKIVLKNGFYNADTINDSFLNSTYTWNDSYDITITPENDLRTQYSITSNFDTSTKLFTFTMNNFNEFKFIWSIGSQNYDDARVLFGFSVDRNISNSITGDLSPDMSVHYFDIVIPEIPYIACKHNNEKRSVIERIPITSAMDELLIYEDNSFNIDDQNYFFPISLDKLTIQLYQKNNKFFDNNNKHHSFEFEITIINKIDLIK